MSKKIGIFGCGTVGLQVIRQLKSRGYSVVGVFSKTRKDIGLEWYESWQDLVKESDIIIEVIGGVGVARDIVFAALELGKDVITANKHLLAEYGSVLLPKYQNQLKFEAAVCASIPIITLLQNYYKNDKILSISGIFNGTTNYILTKLSEGFSFDEALKEAQKLGFAEADPSFDINGIDAVHKAIIMYYLAFNSWIKIHDINIELPKNAKAGEKSICKITENGIYLQNISDERFINTSGINNAILIESQTVGEIFIQGAGAGGQETAFAILSNLS